MKRNFAPPAFVIKLINLAYERVFHEKIGDEVKSFLKNLSYVAVGTLIATLLSFAFNILGGRILGPAEYGKFTLVQSVAMFLYIPMLLGFQTAIVKYTSEKEDFQRQSKIISTTFILVFIFTIASCVLYSIFSSQLSNVFSIPYELFYLSLIFAVLFVFYTVTTSTLNGLFKMKTFAIFQSIYAAIALFAFLLFIFAGNLLSFKSTVYSIFLAYGIVSAILAVFFLRKYLRFHFDKSWANILTQYSMFAVIGGLTFVFYTNVDKIMINRYMTVADVGIYRAYYLASINVAGLFGGVFNTVFFPTASKYQDKGVIFNRINKLIPYLIGLGIPFILVCEFIILKFYGGQYPFNLSWMILFAIAAIIVVIYGFYAWLMASVGQKGIKVVAFSEVISAAVNIGLNIIFIPLIGVSGAIIATITSYSVSLCLVLSKRHLMQRNDQAGGISIE